MKLSRRRGVILLIAATVLVFAYLFLPFHRFPGKEFDCLYNADRFELFSLYPSLLSPPGPDRFDGHVILGSTAVQDRQTQADLRDALIAGIRSSNGSEAACFNPRHGIRVTAGNVVTDFVICFECKQVEVWRDGKMIAEQPTTALPAATFDRVLESAHVQLAPKPE
jgi:hypothetical protein